MLGMQDQPGPRRRWEWWHRQRPVTRKTIRTALALLGTGLVALVFGVSSASATASLGPHEADYHVTLDSRISLQMGPLGAVIIDSPVPGPLGAQVVVHEIPTDIDPTDTDESPVPGLLADLAAYGQLFSHPEAAVANAVRALVSDALGRTTVAWSLMLVLIAAGRLASGGHLRDEVRHALARPGVAALGSAALVCGAAAVVVPATVRDEPAGYSPAVLDGTPLEGAVITGRLADVVAVYGGQIREAVEENNAFYADAADNLAAALDAEPDPAPVALPEPGETDPSRGEVPPSPEATEPGDEPDATSATGEGTAGELPAPEDLDPVLFVMVADVHCNVGMGTVIGTALEHTGAAALLDAGDTVATGTSVESYCIDAIAGDLPADVPVLVSTGNHDSVETAEQERNVGWNVLSGDVAEIEGIRFLGDTDPTLTSIGSGTVQEREETVDEMGERLADQACQAREAGDPVDVLLVHNPRAGLASMERGCVPLQLSGHWHRTGGPEVLDQGVRYVSTSSGGGAGGGATVGPLTSDAEITLLRLDRETGRALDFRRIVIGTDAEVDIGAWEPFPVAPSAG